MKIINQCLINQLLQKIYLFKKRHDFSVCYFFNLFYVCYNLRVVEDLSIHKQFVRRYVLVQKQSNISCLGQYNLIISYFLIPGSLAFIDKRSKYYIKLLTIILHVYMRTLWTNSYKIKFIPDTSLNEVCMCLSFHQCNCVLDIVVTNYFI